MAYKVSKKKLSLFTTNFSLTYFILFIFLTVLMMFMDSHYDYLKQIRKDFSCLLNYKFQEKFQPCPQKYNYLDNFINYF